MPSVYLIGSESVRGQPCRLMDVEMMKPRVTDYNVTHLDEIDQSHTVEGTVVPSRRRSY